MSFRHVGAGQMLRQPQLGAWIRDRLDALALTTKDAGAATGLPAANIKSWASGQRTPSHHGWERLLASLLTLSKAPPPPPPPPPPQKPIESPDGLRELLEGLAKGAGLRAVVLVLEPRKDAEGQLSWWT